MKITRLRPVDGSLSSEAVEVKDIPMQPASLDIWDKKYRLTSKDGQPLDKTIDSTYQRVARALAEVEKIPELRQSWYEKFLWALRQGAIPAGRIISNAGAWEHKPATSTINCTVSGTIEDSMDDILRKVHEAGLTLKAGCVAPGTWVYTEQGLVTADQAVAEQHAEILCYNREEQRFEMRPILRHLTTHVPRAENIEIVSNGVILQTSIKHPVLVYRDGSLRYVRADQVRSDDALVHHRFSWTADRDAALTAWFVGAHLGDGSAYEKKCGDYKPSRRAWAERARACGKRLVFKIRAAEREVVERYAEFFHSFCGSRARTVTTTTHNGTPVWDYTVASFKASRVADLIDQQTGEKNRNLRVPAWVAAHPERYFLPFLAGLIDTDGTVSTERGSVTVAMRNPSFGEQLQALLGLFGVRAGLTLRKPYTHIYNGRRVHSEGWAMLKISDSAFLVAVAEFMADSGKKRRIREFTSQSGQYDRYIMPDCLQAALTAASVALSHKERQSLGFYHCYHERRVVSRVMLNKWAARFPALRPLIDFTITLRPVEAIRRNLNLTETFYDFTVAEHNNYLAGKAGLMVIHNCGIGYEFSTLRPRGAYVSGAGAYTSGPLSFMDIYDKMCFTVSSAGGRRGAQMATFDVSHPDVLEFIRAKREAGRLRQFNLSLLITQEFIEAVKADADWQLAFPLRQKEVAEDGIDLNDSKQVIWRDWPTHDGLVSNAAGRVACKIYKTIRARRLWDVIMSSTYDFAEPGFILIEEVNEMNNNWWCENIRATNPCMTADTWVHTSQGPRQVRDLIGQAFLARVDGKDYASGDQGFFRTATKPVVRLQTREGYSLRLTADHRLRRVQRFTSSATETEWCAASELRPGDRVILNNHRKNFSWQGKYSFGEGYLMGLLIGDGAVLSAWRNQSIANSDLQHHSDFAGWKLITGRGEYRMNSAALTALAKAFDVRPGGKIITPAIERTSSDFHRGFLRGLFDADGSIQSSQAKGVSVRLAQSSLEGLQAVQRMLLRLGITSNICQNRCPPLKRNYPNVKRDKAQHELVISGANLYSFADCIGFGDTDKQRKLDKLLSACRRALNREPFTAVVKELVPDGVEDVYDVQVPGINAFDANGFHTHNCGEQPLPPYGACNLGSINLTKFVSAPFTENPRFDWDTYREVVAIFTRMLDNVVEVSGLPLEQQRREIITKRRHGMGYLGLGSTLTMLGMQYGSPESLQFTEEVTRELALVGWQTALELAKEKGPAPLMEQDFTVTNEMLVKRPEMIKAGYSVGDMVKGKVLHARYSRYMQRIAEVDPELVEELAEVGARFTHHSSIAPTGTISLSLANNASNGVEPSFAHHYFRNVIREGKKSKEKVDVFSFELLAYRALINPNAMPSSEDPEERLPDYFISADDVTPKQHVDIQAAAQKWIDSSISKTANVPTDFPYKDFKDIYLYAYEQKLKGCTTFRFNPEAFQGVLVKEKDLENTTYRFTLEDGATLEVKGNEEIEYDGELHTAANLFDALKEGYYGKF